MGKALTKTERRIMNKLRNSTLQESDPICLCCKELLTADNISVDHIQPKCLGYEVTNENNCQVICRLCNGNKGMLSINYKTKTLIIESYMFSLPTVNLINLLTTGDPNYKSHKGGRERIPLNQIKKKFHKAFIIT